MEFFLYTKMHEDSSARSYQKKKPQKYTNKDFNKNLLKGSKIKSENMVENDLKSSWAWKTKATWV